jgi:Arc/MetJ family transcription regulator
MRTTIDVDEELMEEALAVSGERNRSVVVNKALAEYVRRQRIERLLLLRGNLDLDLDDWYEFRHAERD